MKEKSNGASYNHDTPSSSQPQSRCRIASSCLKEEYESNRSKATTDGKNPRLSSALGKSDYTDGISFLERSYDMLIEAPEEIVCWSEDGHSFIIQEPAHFAEHVIPQFFRHHTFSSFVKNLQYFGFQRRKVTPLQVETKSSPNQQHTAGAHFTNILSTAASISGKVAWEFCHEHFVRGARYRLQNIKKLSTSPESHPHLPLAEKPEIAELKSEVSRLKSQLTDINDGVGKMMKLISCLKLRKLSATLSAPADVAHIYNAKDTASRNAGTNPILSELGCMEEELGILSMLPRGKPYPFSTSRTSALSKSSVSTISSVTNLATTSCQPRIPGLLRGASLPSLPTSSLNQNNTTSSGPTLSIAIPPASAPASTRGKGIPDGATADIVQPEFPPQQALRRQVSLQPVSSSARRRMVLQPVAIGGNNPRSLTRSHPYSLSQSTNSRPVRNVTSNVSKVPSSTSSPISMLAMRIEKSDPCSYDIHTSSARYYSPKSGHCSRVLAMDVNVESDIDITDSSYNDQNNVSLMLMSPSHSARGELVTDNVTQQASSLTADEVDSLIAQVNFELEKSILQRTAVLQDEADFF